ncbi:MAG TPA: chloride channel protein [Kofleriaceae bacterium]|nr:chloride channel protein [Kofleriaceae bacterium]
MTPPTRDSSAGLLVAPSMGLAMGREHVRQIPAVMNKRDAFVAAMACVLGIVACGVAEALVRMIAIVTNLAFYGRWSMTYTSPADNHLGYAVIAVPVVGGIIVGLMARFGSRAIRGHGIPEAMEQILTNEARIPLRITFLKPTSSAIAIGTGGPFGAEGPIIATGGALGSALGQFIHVSSQERKTLLAAGAAAGMTAIFGTPIASVLIAIELLLFEYRARSVVPVALAAACAGGLRAIIHGAGPVFAMPEIGSLTWETDVVATLVGALVGVISVYVTKIIYWIEDKFEELPIHWMWWPAIGAVAVGVIGVFAPRTLGVGYNNIEDALAGAIPWQALIVLVVAKFVSWAIALGTGTSGGTLAPLMTFGSGLGWLITAGCAALAPSAGIDPRVGALVGMTAMFAGASRALLASIAFALEVTQQIHAVVPIVLGVSVAYFASCLLMRTTIMTEKLVRRGVTVASEYDVDPLAHVVVASLASRALHALELAQTVGEALAEIARKGYRHQGYPVVQDGKLIGVVTSREMIAAEAATPLAELVSREPVTVHSHETARAAVMRMAEEEVGRLVVLIGDEPVGMLTRSDVVRAFAGKRGLAPEGL